MTHIKAFISLLGIIVSILIVVVGSAGSGGYKFTQADLGVTPTPTATPTPTFTPTITPTPTLTPTIVPVSCWDGTFNNTEVNGGDHLVLTAATISGDFTSDVIDYGSSTAFTDFAWTSVLPFYKELPSNGVSESITDYPDLYSSTLETGLLGLYHVNETGTNAETLVDSSGNGRDAPPTGTSFYGEAGELQLACRYPAASSYNKAAGYTGLIDGNDPRSFSVWFKDSAGGYAYKGIISNGLTSGAGFNSLSLVVQDSPNMIGIFIHNDPSPITVSATPYMDGEWHHAAVTHDGTTLRLYLDGVEVASGARTLTTTDTDFVWIASLTGANNYIGSIDEVGVWDRALHATEVLQLYRRGANRALFQVRSCDDAACSGESWLGPDGTSGSYFTELNNNTNQEDMDGNVLATSPSMDFANFSSLVIPNNRWWQYKVFLETDNTTYTPEVICTETTP